MDRKSGASGLVKERRGEENTEMDKVTVVVVFWESNMWKVGFLLKRLCRTICSFE